MKKVKIISNKGITIIALVITIIVMLIIATVAINVTSGSSEILKGTEKAENAHETTSEKEAIETAYMQLSGYNIKEEITSTSLQEKINENYGANSVTVTGSEDTSFTITFTKTGRTYTINENGEINSI